MINYNVCLTEHWRRQEYYPFGMQTANSWTRENTKGNNYLSNGGTELNTTTGVYDLHYRNYDSVLGRMNQVDPLADRYGSHSTYNFAFNDPVYWNDPLGDSPQDEINASRGIDMQRNYANSYRTIGDDDMYGSMFRKEGVGTRDFIYDYENKRYVLPAFRNGQWGYWQARFGGVDRSTETKDSEGNWVDLGEVTILPDIWVALEHSLEHYRTMANPIVKAFHRGQRDFVDNPFGGAMMMLVTGGGLGGGGAIAGRALSGLKAMSPLVMKGGAALASAGRAYKASLTLGKIGTNFSFNLGTQIITGQDFSKVDVLDAVLAGLGGNGLGQVAAGALGGLYDFTYKGKFVSFGDKSGYQLGVDLSTGVISGGLGKTISNAPISSSWRTWGGFLNGLVGDGFNTTLTLDK